MFRSPSTALLIKDETRNVFYELEDPRDVQDRCVIKIYCKEPIYGTYPGHHNPHLANGDLRVSVSTLLCHFIPPPLCGCKCFSAEKESSPHFKNLEEFSVMWKSPVTARE